MAILEVRNLKKSYKKGFIPKKQQVLHDVSFRIEPSTVTGFLGGNGAGKTTTMKCILGLAIKDSGEINFFGKGPLTSEIKARIGFLPERPYFYDYLTGEEFLKFYGEVSGHFKKKSDMMERINFLLKKVDLLHARDKALKNYSKGMLQKIGLAQALIHRPEFVILDEPMAGLDPDGRYYLSELISETAMQGTAIFFSSHLLHDTERLCENLVVLKDGKVIYQGKTNQLIDHMSPLTEIHYENGNDVAVEKLNSGDPVQKRLLELLSKNKKVLTVKPEILSLEQAFIKMAMKDSNK